MGRTKSRQDWFVRVGPTACVRVAETEGASPFSACLRMSPCRQRMRGGGGSLLFVQFICCYCSWKNACTVITCSLRSSFYAHGTFTGSAMLSFRSGASRKYAQALTLTPLNTNFLIVLKYSRQNKTFRKLA
jgi:hypothetical protein